MAIASVVTRGFSNGSYVGTIPLVVLRGFISGTVTSDEASRAWCVVARDTYTAGAASAQGYTAGALKEQTYHAGAAATDNC